MSRNVCARCAKPVYFAERKTSLGRDWHPTCLKCTECGRVLSPGQHAEHKGNPYCHTPCYKAKFGPALLGYGSNLASPANFAKKDNAAEFGHDYDDDVYKREIYSNSRTAALRRQKQRRSAPPSILNHDFTSVAEDGASASPRSSVAKSERHPSRIANSVSHPQTNSGPHPSVGHHARSQSMVTPEPVSRIDSSSPEVNGGLRKARSVDKPRSTSVQVNSVNHVGSNSRENSEMNGRVVTSSVSKSGLDNGVSGNSVPSSSVLQPQSSPAHAKVQGVMTPALKDILEKVKSFNSHFEGKVHHQMTVEQGHNGEVTVQGPLRVYWGLSRPIRLRQCDDVPAPPIAKWRHSLWANLSDSPLQNDNSQLQKIQLQASPMAPSPNRARRGVDDSILLSPASGDEVVMRRRNIRKFNTVAYRNDAPTKWKRASINGHIFNYDTSVFTPVLGSSTSVMTDSSMTSPVVIETLLDKFKVENSPGEYVLSVVTENGDQTQERLLGDTDRPLLERLQLGADDQYAKIFLKERRIEPEVTVPDTVQLPIMMEEEEEEETLPDEVEQLMILPVAVLKGILVKYEKDEQKEVRILKAKYERVRRKIRNRLEELKTA